MDRLKRFSSKSCLEKRLSDEQSNRCWQCTVIAFPASPPCARIPPRLVLVCLLIMSTYILHVVELCTVYISCSPPHRNRMYNQVQIDRAEVGEDAGWEKEQHNPADLSVLHQDRCGYNPAASPNNILKLQNCSEFSLLVAKFKNSSSSYLPLCFTLHTDTSQLQLRLEQKNWRDEKMEWWSNGRNSVCFSNLQLNITADPNIPVTVQTSPQTEALWVTWL